VALDENLKKALTELLMLQLLSERDYYAGELSAELNRRSGGTLTIVFPYSAIYRLQQTGCIFESDKHIAPDGRRRQYFRITDTGRAYLAQLLRVYRTFIRGVEDILQKGE
jgi:PadR family transcriptional regulator PadR